MKQSSIDLAKALYKAGYTNVDILTKDGKVSAKELIEKQKKKKKNKIIEVK